MTASSERFGESPDAAMRRGRQGRRMRTRTLLLTAAVVAALGAPAGAQAATIATDDDGALVFRAAPGETNSMSLQGGAEGTDAVTFYVGSTGNITSFPAGCDDHRDWNYVTCPTPSGGVKLELGDGDDDYATSSGSELAKDLKMARA